MQESTKSIQKISLDVEKLEAMLTGRRIISNSPYAPTNADRQAKGIKGYEC